MLLKNLIKKIPNNFKNLNVRGAALNSKEVKKGFIFFALKGSKLNGEHYIQDAINHGAIAIVCSKTCKFKSNKIFIIRTGDIRKYLSNFLKKFYKYKPKNIIAVTGTNGKTSVAEFFYQILSLNNISAATIGTLGIKTRKKNYKTNLTSPDIVTLHRNLEKLKKDKIDNVIIEASSHGLDQKRLDGLKIRIGIFTNFSQDHLDYHKTMKDYLNAKFSLFNRILPSGSYVITDKSLKVYQSLKKICKNRKLKLFNIKTDKIDLIKTNSKIIGTFQTKNLAMALSAIKICNLKISNPLKLIKKIKNVNGRLELVKTFSNNTKVFVDYAHTPDALNEVLQSLKKKFNQNIILVFGCGGDRDFKKRPLMAKIAKKFCKEVYVTDDNPRYENPKKIRMQIIKNLKGVNFHNIGNRSKAIKQAIIKSSPNDIILVAGKGHENTQDYGNKTYFISDKKIIKNVKFNKKRLNFKQLNYHLNSKILNKIIKNKKNYKFDGLAIDSRDIKKGNIFLAHKGKNKDGNDFIFRAIKKGASYVITTKNNKKLRKQIIKVDNPINFLNKFASFKREKSKAKILAITGSAGKTSLKNMLKDLLKEQDYTHASPKSFNNHFGVPLSLANLNIRHKFGIFEVGMSKAGEIDNLSKMIKPDLAIITNIAEAHIENFRSVKEIAKAKGEIIDHLQKNGTIILNRDSQYFGYLSHKAKQKKIRIVTFGKSKNSDIRLIKINYKDEKKKLAILIQGKVFNLKVNFINEYNILASLAVLNELKLDLQNFKKVFENFEPTEGRGKIHNIKRYNKRFKLIDESYNANPLSVKIAINNFIKLKKNNSKKYLLLGDMLELGKKSKIYHNDISKLINRSDIDKVFITGSKTFFTYKSLKKEKQGNIFQYNEDVDLILKNIISNNDYLMIKGSNATGLNHISNAMIKGI